MQNIYISNLAVFNLKACAKEYDSNVVLREYTINQQKDDILKDILQMSSGCDLHILLYLEHYFCAGTDAGSEKDPAGSFLSGREARRYRMMQRNF